MLITGRVQSGSGRNTKLFHQTPQEDWGPLGYLPFPGSLNIRVDRDDRMAVHRLPGVRVGDYVYRPVSLNGRPAHVRTNRGPRTLEILHPERLRDHLSNGDEVTLEVHPPKPMKLSAVVMAHPARRQAVEELQSQLDRDVPVVYDENPVPSSDPEQRWRTGVRAWDAHDPDADWHLVIQDDALVSRDLLAGTEAALTQLGTEGLVSLYAGTGRPDQHNIKTMLKGAERRGHSWGCVRSLNWGPAICAPVNTIPDMLEWCGNPETKEFRPRNDNYDYRIGVYYRDIMKWRSWYTLPSLVEHRGLPSLIGHDDIGHTRKAHQFHEGSALDIDWTLHQGLSAPLIG